MKAYKLTINDSLVTRTVSMTLTAKRLFQKLSTGDRNLPHCTIYMYENGFFSQNISADLSVTDDQETI